MVERPVWSAKWVRPGPDRPDLTWLKGPGDVISNPEFSKIPHHMAQGGRMMSSSNPDVTSSCSSAGSYIRFSNLTTYSTASHGYGFPVRVWVYCNFLGLDVT